ncbi:MAG: DUF111 family protein [Acidobacteria bacterium]|nr:DUF111 family protein [Acidobacteriota bacterium]
MRRSTGILHHIEAIIGNSTLAESVRSRAIAIFTRLAEAEARSRHRLE